VGGVVLVLGWIAVGAVLAQLAFVQVNRRGTQRIFCAAAFAVSLVLAAMLLTPSPGTPGEGRGEGDLEVEKVSAVQITLTPTLSRSTGRGSVLLSAFGIATMSGIALMDMLLGHAYLTASQMTMAPFRRLNLGLAGHLIFRAIVSIGVAMLMAKLHPIYMLWGKYGLLILTRWFVGLAVPAVFVYMAHDCIKRRATQSATGILYVAGVLIFIGEIIALNLVSETGICF